MKLSKIASAITSMMMFISTGLQNFSTSSAATEQNADSTHSIISEDNMKIETTNSFGNLFASELSAKQEEQIENNGYNIFSIEMEDNVATVDYQVQGDCTLIVGIYDDSATTMIASGTAEVKADETLATVEIPVLAMPKYFYIKAYLVGTYTLEPLCLEYKNPNYTQHMQEFFSKTTDDFDQEKVINFDEDKTNNFAVYSDDVIIIPYEEGFNTSITYDEESGTYTIENASEAIQALKEGDLFAYDDEVLGPVTTKIGSISINGTTVTIIIDDTDIHEVFDYVRIDTSQDLGDAEAECYNGAELVNLNTQENSTRVRMPGEPPIVKSAQDKSAISYKFEYDFTEESTDSSEKDKDEDKDKDKDKEKDDKKPYIDADADISLTASLQITVEAVLNLDLNDDYMEINIDCESNVDFSAEGKVELDVPLGKYKFKPVPGLDLTLQPSLVFELSAKFTLNVNNNCTLGIKIQDGKVTNNSKWPVAEIEVKGEVSLFVGFKLNPKFKFIHEKIISAKSNFEIGIKITASLSKSVDSKIESDVNKIKDYHECKSCIDGDIKFVLKMNFNITFVNSTVTFTPLDISPKIADFYYSFDNNEFGFGECPSKVYRIELRVKDSKNRYVEDAVVSRKSGASVKEMISPYVVSELEEAKSGEDGKLALYFNVGDVELTLSKDGYKTKTVDLKISLDDDDNLLINGEKTTSYDIILSDITYKVVINVKDSDNNVVPYPKLEYKDNRLHSFNGSKDGVIEFNVKPGNYDFDISQYDYSPYTLSETIDKDSEFDVQLEKLGIGDVKFIIKDKDGNPLQRIMVTSTGLHVGMSDEDGVVIFTDMHEGTHEAYFRNADYTHRMTVEFTVIKDDTVEIEVVFGDDTDTEDVTTTTEISSDETVTTTSTTTSVPANIVDSGTCGDNGDNLTWTLDDEGTLIISGTGDMKNYSYNYNGSPWYKNKDIKAVMINEGVTSIGRYAFRYCNNLASVTIPDSVTVIGISAFEGCSSLTSITIPDSVTSIGKYAFEGCSGLTSITIPDSVTSIGESAFYNCSSLTSITIPDSVTAIGDDAFYYCKNLTEITIPDSVTSIGESAFYNCSSLTSITIPDSVTSIKDSVFKDCSDLTSIIIPDSVTSIGESAFYNCSSLTSITIPDSVTSVGRYAFADCHSLTSVNIPDGVTGIGNYAFSDCSNLTSITIPDSVTSIGKYAFNGCSGLTSINIPDGITSIKEYTFEGCSGLTSITIPDGVTDIGWYAFSDCSNLTSITIPDSVTSISDYAFFNCSSLKSITIPDGVTGIGWYAFSDCSNLTSITIPDSVTSISDHAFEGCSSLTSITIPDSVTSIGMYAFNGCSSLTSITIPDSVTSISDHAFGYCSSLTSIIIPDSVTSIEEGVFKGCSGLTSITIPDSVTSIRDWAFEYCDGLTSITIPDSVTNIGAAFNSCDNLESITIENPDCEIEYYYYHSYAIPKTTTIYGYSGSTAETYAEEWGYEFVALDEPQTISMIQEKPIEILAEESVEVLAEEPTEILAEEPAEVLVEEPTEILAEEPTEILAEEPTEILAEEPTEILTEEPTETADDTADDSYILLEPAIHSFTDLLPNTVYNYYIMYNNTDLDILFNPGNIQYVSQFITDENGNAEVDLGYTEITEEAVKFTVPASVSEKNYKLGDVNGDGMVDAVDASYILRIYAVYSTDGTPEETEEQLLSAEVNGDGSIDAVDAAIVLAYYAHLSTGGTDDIETFISNNIDNTQ